MPLKLVQVLSVISEMTYCMTYYKHVYMILDNFITPILSWNGILLDVSLV